MTGRPRSEMTKENVEAILRAVRLGVWPNRAAEMNGVSAVAMRKHKERHPAFVTAIKKAEAEAESSVHGKVLRHMDKQWTACAWMLERRWPERWARKDRDLSVSGSLSIAPSDMAEKIRAALRAAKQTVPTPTLGKSKDA